MGSYFAELTGAGAVGAALGQQEAANMVTMTAAMAIFTRFITIGWVWLLIVR